MKNEADKKMRTVCHMMIAVPITPPPPRVLAVKRNQLITKKKQK